MYTGFANTPHYTAGEFHVPKLISRECPICPVESPCPFQSLEAKAFGAFRDIAQKRLYQRGRPVRPQGESAAGVFIVCSGMVKLTHVTPDGRSNTLGMSGPGSVLGLTDVVSGVVSETGAEAFEDTVLCFVEERDFKRFLCENPGAAIELLRATSLELNRVLAEFCAVVGKVPPSTRLLHALQELARTHGRPVTGGIRLNLQLTQEELARRIGCSRQWLSRILQVLEAEGAIRHERGRIELKVVTHCSASCITPL
jgi:CRP/FNR family transcriptional regulator